MSDIRKWFMKQHGPENFKDLEPSKSAQAVEESFRTREKSENQVGSGRHKTSKYFSKEKNKPKDEDITEKGTVKRVNKQATSDLDPLPAKKLRKATRVSDDDDYAIPGCEMDMVDSPPNKRPKSSSRGLKSESDDKEVIDTSSKSLGKSTGSGRGGRSGSGSASSASGRGRGRGGFTNFGERKDPPHKGEKEIPSGDPCCLSGSTFVISGTLDSLEREEAEDLIKRHGGRITSSISKKTNYLLCDEDIGGRKSSKAKELGTTFLTEDELFDMIRASMAPQSSRMIPKHSTKDLKTVVDMDVSSSFKAAPQTVKFNDHQKPTSVSKDIDAIEQKPRYPPSTKKPSKPSSLTWTEKYKPKTPNEIIGNQSLVKQLHDWLAHWNENFLHNNKKVKGKRQDDGSAKKAILLSGSPGMGKTTSAKLVSQMLGFHTIEVNASDSRGKSDSKIHKGIEGKSANSIKELISNEAFSVKANRLNDLKTVLIMDEVDGMSAGDRGGVADLIDSIKLSKIPIICICNDRYSQKLKSLVNHCLLLNFRKPTKQQMAKRLLQISSAEGLETNEISLEELSDRVNGDMRMAVNQLQYMSFNMHVIKYDDVRKHLMSSAKDEDISPFNAVDKLFGLNGGKLRMDERINLSMSDPDLVPLIIQENYMNYRPNLVGKDDNGLKRMGLIARAAESIGDGDIFNVSIRRYRLWQLSQSGSVSSTVLPAALLHGSREILEQGERNFNRFGGWLGKNSTMGKNLRLLEDLHGHFLASREYNGSRVALRTEYLSLLLIRLTDPLRKFSKDEAVQNVLELMDCYSVSQEDFDSLMLLSKFQGKTNPLDGVQPAVKAALTRAYNQGFKTRTIRSADMIALPGLKKTSKKRIPAIKGQVDEVDGVNGDELVESASDSSETEESGNDKATSLDLDMQIMKSKGIQVQVDLNKKETNVSGGKGKKGRGSEFTKKVANKSASKRKK